MYKAINRLKVEYLELLAAEISRPRQGRPPPWLKAVRYLNPRHVAAIVLDCVLRPTSKDDDDDDNEPVPRSRQGVAIDIARSIGMPWHTDEEVLVKAGIALLGLAADVGLIESIRRPWTANFVDEEPWPVYLSPEADARLSELLEQCEAIGFRPPDDPLIEPAKGRVAIIQNRRGLIEPPELPSHFVEALDHIRQTPWQVNKDVFKVMTSKLRNGDWRYLADLQLDRRRTYSKRNEIRLAFDAARRYRGTPIYFDVHCDYRGRVYQRGPLRFTGAGHYVQALLEFAEGEIVTDEGARYLAAYVAAQWQDEIKSDIDHLEQWTLENTATLLAVASNPHKNKRWWKRPEDKRWHALAAAYAWQRYTEGKSVHLPCRFDAVSSGLQIFAMLMRDKELAWRVALMMNSRGIYYEELADQCNVTRKAAKAVAMPLLYNSTQQSSERALAKLDGKKVSDAWRYREQAKQLRAKAEVPAFVNVRDWLARDVAGVFRKVNKEIRWKTPFFFFEVVMDNRVMEGIMVKAHIEGRPHKKKVDGQVKYVRTPIPIAVVLQKPSEKLDHRKQRTALPANIVHSLDASLLAATVYFGEREWGIKHWGCVHDCYATRANDAGSLVHGASKAALHYIFDKDWLEWLHRQLEEHADEKIPEPPAGHDSEVPGEFYFGERSMTV